MQMYSANYFTKTCFLVTIRGKICQSEEEHNGQEYIQ